MHRTRKISITAAAGATLAMGMLLWHGAASAQGQETYKGRLAPVPVDAKTRPDIGGFGTATAVLAGSKLTVSGSFQEFKSAATSGKIHMSRATGVRGPAVFDLTVPKATSGNFNGTFDLNPQQVEAAKKSLLYVQIQSEKAPDGNVWGWLLK